MAQKERERTAKREAKKETLALKLEMDAQA